MHASRRFGRVYDLPGLAMKAGRNGLNALFLLLALGAADVARADERPMFWWNDPVGADDTVQVAGANLAGLASVSVEVLDDKGDGAGPQAAEVIAVAPFMVKFLLPASLPHGLYRATLNYPETAIQILLNRPTVYWAQGDLGSVATPGGVLTVIGRDIARSPNARLELTSATGTVVSIAVARGDLWTARFTLPADLSPGRYLARIFNGEGGAAGLGEIGPVTVDAAAIAAAPATTLRPTGGDDTASIATALAALGQSGGGVLQLAAGRYRMSGPLVIPRHVTLAGVSRDEVVLNWLDNGPAMEALISGHSDFTVRDLTIYSNKLVNVVRAGFRESLEEADGHDITLSGLTIRASYLIGHLTPEDAAVRMHAPDTVGTSTFGIALSGSDHKILDCDVLSTKSPLMLMRPVNGLVRGNTFNIGRGGWYTVTGANGLIIEGNTFKGIDLQAAGGGINTLDSSVAASQNVLLDGNLFEDSLGWDREAITTDGPGGFYFGAATLTSPRELAIGAVDPKTSRPSSWAGAGVFVLSGAGVGQWARVAERDGSRVTLDRELSAPLDATSEVTIVPLQRRYVFVHNNFTDVGPAIQTYGTALEHVIADNTLLRSDGIRIWGLVYKVHPQPGWFNQVLDNRVSGASVDGASAISLRATQRNGSKSVMNMGSVVRGNELGDTASITLDGYSKTVLGLTNAIVEHNRFAGSGTRLVVGGGVGSNILRQNGAGE